MFYALQKLALASILQVGSHRQRHQDPQEDTTGAYRDSKTWTGKFYR